jgi:polysaccharide export outer membrane protein
MVSQNWWLRAFAITGLILLFVVTTSFDAFAQSSVQGGALGEDEVLKYYEQAKASGMSQMEIEQAAMAKGYTLSDIETLRKKLSSSSAVKEGAAGHLRESVGSTREVVEETPAAAVVTATPAADPAVFGSAFFSEKAISFEPNLKLATPRNYVLGPDDALIVDIYGNSVDNFNLKVSPEGTVKMLNLKPLYVNGLTIEQATDRIVRQLRTVYAGLNVSGTYANVTLSGVRTIKVMVTGSVVHPGTFSVSSLATAFNVLYLSGGPSSNGSFRKIRVIRNNSVVTTIDLYDFLINASLKDNIAMQDQDIIKVEPYDRRVEINGEVRREGLYELKEGETLQDLINYTDGFTSKAYSGNLTLERSTGVGYKILTIDAADFASTAVNNGDKVTVGTILERYENRVTIGGAVFRPGPFAIQPGLTTVKELIKKAQGLREDVFRERAILMRKRENLEDTLIVINLNDLLSGKTADIALQKDDNLYINAISELRTTYTVSITGFVREPKQYPYVEGMTVADLILQAKGLNEAAVPYRIEIARRVKEDTTGLAPTQNIRIYPYTVDPALSSGDAENKFELKPFDIVFIRKSPRYEAQKTVYIGGEVYYPGHYAIINDTERVSDLIKKSGGLKPYEYLEAAQFKREGNFIAVDIKKIISNPSIAGNIHLEDGDSLFIPKKPELVQIGGDVLHPSIVNFDRSYSFKDYISQAGGFGDNARKSKSYVTHPNGITERTKKFLFIRDYPDVNPGSVVIVPTKAPKTDKGDGMSATERITMFSILGTMAISLYRIISDTIK